MQLQLRQFTTHDWTTASAFYNPDLPNYNLEPFELDFEQGLTLKLTGGTSVGSVTVIFS